MADIRSYIENTLLEPLKYYPTAIQDTMIELIASQLEELYNYTIAFPEIVSPNSSRLDILKVIADQFVYTIRDEADLQEQIDILDNILYVYSKRGSIDTIENMWKYYGGDLPKDVQVIVPANSLFRFSTSKYTGSHVFPDATTHRPGIYEIKLTNSNYPTSELKEFMLRELVAAGNYIYFSNVISADVMEDISSDFYKYIVHPEHYLELNIEVPQDYSGVTFSGNHTLTLSGAPSNLHRIYDVTSPLINTKWSGKANIFLEVTNTYEIQSKFDFFPDVLGFYRERHASSNADYGAASIYDLILMSLELYCTPVDSTISIAHHLYNNQGETVKRKEHFILGESLLGEPLGYEII